MIAYAAFGSPEAVFMRTTITAAEFLPERLTLRSLRTAAMSCQGCQLYQRATQTVFGEGPSYAEAMFVGETPGDQEDQQGRPFVGPAGRFLDEALREAGFDRRAIYLTNAVKHFSWDEAGHRRLHKKPKWSEIRACRPWLTAEIAAVAPKLIVCLGATAAQSLLGPDFRITKQRGRILETEWAAALTATYHPSAILRAPDRDAAARMRREFIDDLRLAKSQLS